MSLLDKSYQPQDIEAKWYQHWMEKEYFRSVPNEKKPFTIVIPPPNVTGVLHMGHILNNTIQDVLIRRARMQGFNACWVPGTDHASIATEAKVVHKLKEEGINKWDISREEFLRHAFEWKDRSESVILKQLRTLGASCDWSRTRFTMEDKLSKAVIQSFVDLYNKGLVYKGWRMTNWDSAAKTAVSDEEVYHKEEQSNLYFLRYQIEDSDAYITIATTRPETIMGDTAICFHPEDERYTHLKGKRALIPLLNKSIPLIYDEYVDRSFGTGALKITPAHDINDYEIGKRHNLDFNNILNEDGTLNSNAKLYVGEDRFIVRKKIVKELDAKGHLVKLESHVHKIGYSERTHVVIEPRLTQQWFVRMEELSKPALEHVMDDTIKFFPDKYKNVYRHWMENIRDWCISRQLWWGQRIPAYYYNEDEYVVAISAAEALPLVQAKPGYENIKIEELRQDSDVVDTWFSSWLWPIAVFDGFERRDEVDYYYPTDVLVTGWDIIFFWVARMVIAGYEWRGEKPFHNVYFTGMVRDKQGRKMSKSLGNSPEPMELIKNYGADGVRIGVLLSAPAGGDLLYDDKLVEQGRNFSNKIWNACRLVKGWETREGKNEELLPVIDWFEHKLQRTIEATEKSYSEFRLSEVVNTLYNFIWDDFFSNYLELIKPEFGQPIDAHTKAKTLELFEVVLQLLHPYMPFITEEIYHQLAVRAEDDCIIISKYPVATPYDNQLIEQGDMAIAILSKLRDTRQRNSLGMRELFELQVQSDKPQVYASYLPIIIKKGFIRSWSYTQEEPSGALTFLANNDKFFFITGQAIDTEAEKLRITAEIDYLRGFLDSVMVKLSNEKFVSSAPAKVVDIELKKKADTEDKIKMLEDSLRSL